ncbi:MAG: hypothetical protein ABIH03_01650 [Pseudomonadota bacterium]
MADTKKLEGWWSGLNACVVISVRYQDGAQLRTRPEPTRPQELEWVEEGER